MAAVLLEGLPVLGLEVDDDIVSYLVDLLETEGVESCAEWLESACNGSDPTEARKLAERAFAALDGDSTDPQQAEGGQKTCKKVAESLDEVVKKLAGAVVKADGEVTTNGVSRVPGKQLDELDDATRRDIVQRYACVEIQTLHLDEDGNFYSSGVAVDGENGEEALPENRNVSRVRQEQHEMRLSQKQKHLEEQEKLKQQKLERQRREEKEKLRCQKKERHK